MLALREKRKTDKKGDFPTEEKTSIFINMVQKRVFSCGKMKKGRETDDAMFLSTSFNLVVICYFFKIIITF